MLVWPDWNKLYAKGQCLYYWVPFSDEQWAELNAQTSEAKKEELIRKWREEYLSKRDIVTGKLKEEVKAPAPAPVETKAEEPKEKKAEESIEDVKPSKAKKGK